MQILYARLNAFRFVKYSFYSLQYLLDNKKILKFPNSYSKTSQVLEFNLETKVGNRFKYFNQLNDSKDGFNVTKFGICI